MRLRSALVVALPLLACEPNTIPLQQFQRDAAPQSDATVRRDLGTTGDATGAGDAGLPPCPEGPAEPPASAAQAVVLASRTSGRVAWVSRGCLYQAPVTAADLEGGGLDVSVGEIGEVGPVPDGDGPLLGGVAEGVPWAIWPDADGALKAYDVASGAVTDLELWGPGRIAHRGRDQLLVVGRAGPEADARVAWRTLEDAPGVLRLDDRGLPPPDFATSALNGWVLTFPGGLCAYLSPGGELVAGDDWWCNARPDARPVGATLSVVMVGESEGDVVLWFASPGYVGVPAPADPVEVPDAGGFVDATVDAGYDATVDAGYDAGYDAGFDAEPDAEPDFEVPDAEVPDTDAPDAAPPPPDDRTIVLAEGGAVLGWLGSTFDGRLVRVRAEGVESLWLIEAASTARVDAPIGDAWGLLQLRGTEHLVEWDAAAGAPTLRTVELVEGPEPPDPLADVQPAPAALLPEDCTEADRDSDGDAQGGRCCSEPLPEPQFTLPLGLTPDGPFFAHLLEDEIEFTLAARPPLMGRADRAALVAAPYDAGGDPIPTGDLRGAPWEGVRQLVDHHRFDGVALTLADEVEGEPEPEPDAGVSEDAGLDFGVEEDAGFDAGADAGFDEGVDEGVDAEVDAGPPAPPRTLLWTLGQGRVARDPVPCDDPLAVRVLTHEGDESRARIYCADEAFDLVPGEAFEGPLYPEGERLRWMKRGAFGSEVLLLVARGPEHTLELWVDADDDEILTEALPEVLVELEPDDRTLPIHLPVVNGGRIARINEARLEVWVPGSGWRPAASTAWPIEVRLSDHAPFAVTAGFVENPVSDEGAPLDVDVRLFAHHLVERATWWGTPVRTNPSRVRRPVYQGIGVASDPGEPNVFRASGASDVEVPEIRMQGYDLVCRPPR